MTCNFLFLNSEKTEVIVFGLKHLRNILSNYMDILDGVSTVSSTTTRNLRVSFEPEYVL